MPKKSIVLLPETENILEQMGLQIKYARLRRKNSAELVAELAGVLHALNYMDKDLLLIVKDDELGRKLQDLDLPVRKRVTRKG